MRREHFDGEVSTSDRLAESHSLPTITLLQLTFCSALASGEVEFVFRIVVKSILLDIELVELRMSLPEDSRGDIRTCDVENDNLIASFLQPTARQIERLLRSDVLESAQGMTVDIDQTFAERLHIDECVAHLSDVYVATEVASQEADGGIECRSFAECFESLLVCVGHGAAFPLSWLIIDGADFILCRQSDIADDAFIVLYSPAEVYSSHAFHYDDSLRRRAESWQLEAFLILGAVELSHKLSSYKHLSIVVSVHSENGRLVSGRQCDLINHGAVAHIHLFEGVKPLSYAVNAALQCSIFGESDPRKTDERHRRFWQFWQFFVRISL